MSGIGGEGNEDEESNRGSGPMELRRHQDHGSLQEIKSSRHRRTASLKYGVGNIARSQRADRRYEGDQESQQLEAGRFQVDIIKILHVPGKPLIDGLANRSGAGIG